MQPKTIQHFQITMHALFLTGPHLVLVQGNITWCTRV